MELVKQTLVDKIEVNLLGVVLVRTATQVVEDGDVIATTFHRHTIVPGQDYSLEDDRVQSICSATHTPEIIEAYQAAIAAQGV